MPDDARDLIEGVFGEPAQDEILAGLSAATLRAEGACMAEMSLAGLNALTLDYGYSDTGGPWQEDEVTPTRLGEPSITVRLARWDGDHLLPWSDNPIHPWEMSDVSVRRSVLSAEAQPQDQRLSRAIAQAKEHMPDKGKWRIVIPLGPAEHGLWQGRALHESGQTVEVDYSPVTGFHAEREGKKK